MNTKSKYMMLECMAMRPVGPGESPWESAHFIVPDEMARQELTDLVHLFERRYDLKGVFTLSEFDKPYAVAQAWDVLESWVSEPHTDLNDPLPLTVPELALYIQKHGPVHTWDETRAARLYRNAPPELIQLVVNARLPGSVYPTSPQPASQSA